MNHRVLRVQELIKRELGNDIQREYDFKGVLVSLHDVEMPPDLKSAKVFIGVIGDQNRAADIIERLNAERGMIQGRLAKRVVLRNTPRLHFIFDDSVERGVQMVDLLDSLEPAPDNELPTDGEADASPSDPAPEDHG